MPQLPYVNINYDNGAIAQAVASNDGLLCIAVIGFDSKSSYLEAGKPVLLTCVNDLVSLRVNSGYEPNGHIFAIVEDFYKEAPEGTRVYLVVYPDTLSMSGILATYDPYLTEVFLKTKKEIRGFIIARKYNKGDEEGRNDDGMHSEPEQAIIHAQQFGNWTAQTHNAPVFVLLENYLFSFYDSSLETGELSGYDCNRVGLITGCTSWYYNNQAVGLVAGRIAVTPVHRHIGRVKTGAIKVDSISIDGTPINDNYSQILTENHHITFRSLAGKAGFFIADDCLCSFDDYCSLTRRRTIDKAYRIAYALLIEELNDEIPVNGDGTMLETYATAFEQSVENAIALNMTRNGELSVDPSDANDTGVKCTVDRTVNVLATNQIKATLRVRPFGYAKYIDVLLGFTIVQ